jgi:hypothetical protein
VVDFAYSVHTQLGNEMTVALVNGRLVPPSYQLSNGEVVEIKREPRITQGAVKRHEQWMGIVRTKVSWELGHPPQGWLAGWCGWLAGWCWCGWQPWGEEAHRVGGACWCRTPAAWGRYCRRV